MHVAFNVTWVVRTADPTKVCGRTYLTPFIPSLPWRWNNRYTVWSLPFRPTTARVFSGCCRVILFHENREHLSGTQPGLDAGLDRRVERERLCHISARREWQISLVMVRLEI